MVVFSFSTNKYYTIVHWVLSVNTQKIQITKGSGLSTPYLRRVARAQG